MATTGDCKGWLIGPEMGGMRAMFTMMNNARLNVGLQGVQIGERATQAARQLCARPGAGRQGDHRASRCSPHDSAYEGADARGTRA